MNDSVDDIGSNCKNKRIWFGSVKHVQCECELFQIRFMSAFLIASSSEGEKQLSFYAEDDVLHCMILQRNEMALSVSPD